MVTNVRVKVRVKKCVITKRDITVNYYSKHILEIIKYIGVFFLSGYKFKSSNSDLDPNSNSDIWITRIIPIVLKNRNRFRIYKYLDIRILRSPYSHQSLCF